MSNLTHVQPREYEVLPTGYQDYPMVAAKIFEGSAVSDNGSPGSATGNVETLVAGENFIGFANTTVDNSGGSAGGVTINVITEGVITLSVTGVTSASTGVTVYASDGNTFTTTSSGNSSVGKVVKVVTGTTALVKFQGAGYRSI